MRRYLILLIFFTVPLYAQEELPSEEDCNFYREAFRSHSGRPESALFQRSAALLPLCGPPELQDIKTLLAWYGHPEADLKFRKILYQNASNHLKAKYLLPVLADSYFENNTSDTLFYGLLIRKIREWNENTAYASEHKDPSHPSFEYLSVHPEAAERLQRRLSVIFKRGIHSPNQEIRIMALEGLGLIRDESALPLILKSLAAPFGTEHFEKEKHLIYTDVTEKNPLKTDHADPEHRAALTALRHMALPRTAAVIRPYLYSADAATELTAIQALEAAGTQEALVYLAERSSVLPLRNPAALRRSRASLSDKLFPETGYAKTKQQTAVRRPDSSFTNAILQKGNAVFPSERLEQNLNPSDSVQIKTHTGITAETEKGSLIRSGQ